MPVIPNATWSEILPGIRTGDVMLFFRPNDAGSRLLADVTDSPYSHVAMLVRGDPAAPPMLWQEASEAPAPDPHHGNAAHPGAQLGDALAVLNVMTSAPYDMIPYYRTLNVDRNAAFEQSVMDAITAFDGIPFPDESQMIGHAVEGRYLGSDSGKTNMFCAQLVAATYQRVGLLDTTHPANWYNQGSFGGVGKCKDDCDFLRGASWGGPAAQLAVPLS